MAIQSDKIPTPRISVALCTYNGEQLLPTQWQSLLDQEMLPNEVVVCDDCSTDGTVALLHQLAATAPFSVRVEENPVQLGSDKNFEKALNLCTGDLLFICDQDDCWLPAKIRVMADYLAQHPTIDLAFCDAYITDANLNQTGQLFWETVFFSPPVKDRWLRGEAMDILLEGNRVMGCATVMRRSFLSKALPLPPQIPGYIYDGWLALLGAATDSIHFVDEPLLLYRTHEKQQIGTRHPKPPPKVHFRDRLVRDRSIKLAPLYKTSKQLQTIAQLIDGRLIPQAGLPPTKGIALMRRRLDHFRLRSSLPANRLDRIIPVLREFGRGNYHYFAVQAANQFAPYLAALGDLVE